jgi:ligand-binding sensor domain-containing protein
VSYPSGGLSRYDETCQCFRHLPELYFGDQKLTSSTRIFFSDDQGRIWFSSWGTGLNIYNPASGKLSHFDLTDIHPGYSDQDKINYNSVLACSEDTDGRVWLATQNGLYRFDPKVEKLEYFPYGTINPKVMRNDAFNSVTLEGTKGLWLSAWGGGICYFDKATKQFSTYKWADVKPYEGYGNVIYHILRRNDHEIWISSEDAGPGIFDTETKKFHFLGKQQIPALQSDYSCASKCLTTPEGFVFFITCEGLIKYDPYSSYFRFHTLPISKSQNSKGFRINRILDDPDYPKIYFGLELGNGLNAMDTRTGILKDYPLDVKASKLEKLMIVEDMLIDRSGNMWVLSTDYLYEFDRKKEELRKLNQAWGKLSEKEQEDFESIAQSPDGSIWILTHQGGLYPFDPDSKSLQDRINAPDDPAHQPSRISKFCIDQSGLLWMKEGPDVWTFHPEKGQFHRILPDSIKKFTEKGTRGLARDGDGQIWLAVRNKGLLKIKHTDGKILGFDWVGTADGMPTLDFYNLESDPAGDLWITTNSGVIYYQTRTRKIRNFNHTVGMDKKTIILFLLKGYRDEFYISSQGNYCKVDYQAINRRLAAPKVYLDRFYVLNQERAHSFSPDSALIIHPGENFFSFDFSCIDYSEQFQHRFAYKLEGWDKDWVYCGSRRYAGYTNLNGGYYTFRVKAANNEGTWSDELSVPVFIEIPFYKKNWFLLVAVLIFTGLIYGLYHYRIRQIEKTERLKTEFNRQLAETRMQALRAQMNPHFIFNCLNSINRYIIKSDIKTSSLYLTRFAKLIRLVLDNSEKNKVLLSREIEALKLYIDMESLRFDHKFGYEVSVGPEVDVDQIEIPPLLIQPYVENAIWHGLLHKESGGMLTVKISQQGDTLVCEITDNGIGREKAMEYKSHSAPTRASVGMKLTEERLAYTQNTLNEAATQKITDLKNEQGEPCGTQVILNIPI